MTNHKDTKWDAALIQHGLKVGEPSQLSDAFRAGANYAANLTERKPVFTTGHCKEKAKAGGCQLHNLQCGYPACDRKLT